MNNLGDGHKKAFYSFINLWEFIELFEVRIKKINDWLDNVLWATLIFIKRILNFSLYTLIKLF